MGYFIRRALVLAAIIAIIGLATLPIWTGKLGQSALAHPKSPGSPAVVKRAIRVKMAIFMYDDALSFSEKALEVFPNSSERPYFMYVAALCAEKEEEPERAIQWFSRFVEEFPDHPWTLQAKGRLRKLQAMNEPAK